MPINILMPALSPTMTEGTLARWLKKEGDEIKSGQVIAEIETDKATMEVEAVEEGKLGKILVAAGTSGVAVNAPIAVLLEEGESAESIKAAPVAATPVAAAAPAPVATVSAPAAPAAPAPVVATAPASSGRIFATPLAKRIAKEKGIDLSALKGTGPNGRVVMADVTQAPAAAASATASAAPVVTAPATPTAELLTKLGQSFTPQPNGSIRKVIARRLTEAKQQIPHFYLSVDCRIDTLLATRKRINEAGNKVSVNDFVILATAQALKEVPAANAAWSDDAILQFNDIDVSVAVATPNGLITPIIKKANTKGLAQISAEMKELAEKARAGKLRPEEFQGGGFSISNLGMFGVKQFSAIINPPQSCILAVGAGEQRPVVQDGKIEIGTVMCCTLSVDHRAVDGAVGAEFLAAFKRRIEEPALLLL